VRSFFAEVLKRIGFGHHLDDDGNDGLKKRICRRTFFGIAAALSIAATGLISSEFARAAIAGVIVAGTITVGALLHALVKRKTDRSLPPRTVTHSKSRADVPSPVRTLG
jgi:hypothetical protein